MLQNFRKIFFGVLLFLALSPASALATTETSSLTGSFGALGQTVQFNANAPTAGGTLSGSFSGACTGAIDGNFTAGTNAISGSINGQCNIVGHNQPFALNYSGSIDAGNRKLIVSNISHADGSSSVVTNFIQLPVNTDINITTALDQVTTGTTYTDPQNSNVKVSFNSLPVTPGSLSFNQAALTPAQILQYHAINGTAYQLVSSMPDGTFNFDLTLPFQNGINLSTLIIRYGASLSTLDNIVTQSLTDNGDGTFTIHNLNHFTYFVATVVIPQPSVSFTNPINNANKNSVTLTGTGLSNGHVNYTFTDAGSAHSVSGTGVVEADGTISIPGIDLSSLNDGAINLSVTIDDGLGNVSDPGTSTSTKDASVPNTPTATVNNPVNLSNRNNVILTISGEIGTTYNYTISDGVHTPITGTGTLTSSPFNISGLDLSSFNDGTISISVTLTDSVGNQSTVGASTSTKDTAIPLLSPVSVLTSNASSLFAKIGNLISLLFTSNEAIQTPTVTIAGHAVSAVNTSLNNWLATYVMVAGDTEGFIPYSVNFLDIAGNSGASINTNSTINFDKTSPTLIAVSVSTSNSNPSFAKVGDTITLDFVSSEVIQSPTVTIAGHIITAVNTSGNNWRATYVMTGSDTQGLIPYTINFQDLAGNTGTPVNTNSSITFDRTNPTLTVTTISSSNANGSLAKMGDTITLNFTSSETIQNPTVTIAGHPISAFNVGGNSWRATYVMVNGDTEGLMAYTISFTDLAGNNGTSVNTNSAITFDSTSPTINSTITTSNGNSSFAKVGDNITLSFTASETIQTPTVTIAGHSVAAVNTVGNTWVTTYVMTDLDTEGAINYIITFQDLASNLGISVNTNSAIVFDRTNPAFFSTTVSTSNPNSSFAKVGDNVTLDFTTSEAIQAPVVTIAGHNVTVLNISGNSWRATYIMTGSDTEGLVAYTVTFQDLASNAGTNVNTNSAINFDRTNSVTSDDVDGLWHNAVVTVHLNCTDSLSGCQKIVYTTDGSDPAVSATAVIVLGNSATFNLPEGVYTIKYFSVDTAGNQEATVTSVNQLRIDLTNPTGGSDNVIAGWFNTNPTIILSVADALSGLNNVRYSWDAPATASFGIVFTNGTTISIPSNGVHTLYIFADDNAGNPFSFSAVYRLDTILPVISGITLVNNTTGNSTYVRDGDTVSLTATITDNNQTLLTTAMITADLSSLGGGSAVHPTSYDTVTGLATWAPLVVLASGNGVVTITIHSLDIANNPVNQSVTTLADNIAPTTVDNTSSAWFTNSVTITLTCADANGCSQTYYTTDGSIPTLASATGNTVIFTSNGIFTIRYFSVDLAGNAGPVLTALNQVKVDIVFPTGSWVNPVAGRALKNTINISFTSADDFSGVASAQAFYKKNNGIDTFHPLPSSWDTYPLDLGSYTLRLVVTDVAGNVTTIDEVVDIIAVILNPKSDTTSFTAGKVTWETNHPTTSRVVYDTVSHDIGIGPNYGYYGSTSEVDGSYTLNHMLMLESLSSYTRYFARVISRVNGGSDSIGPELTLMTFSIPGSASAPGPIAAPVQVQPKKQEGEIGFGMATAFAAEKEASVEGQAKQTVNSPPPKPFSDIPLFNFTRQFSELVDKIVYAILNALGQFLKAILIH